MRLRALGHDPFAQVESWQAAPVLTLWGGAMVIWHRVKVHGHVAGYVTRHSGGYQPFPLRGLRWVSFPTMRSAIEAVWPSAAPKYVYVSEVAALPEGVPSAIDALYVGIMLAGDEPQNRVRTWNLSAKNRAWLSAAIAIELNISPLDLRALWWKQLRDIAVGAYTRRMHERAAELRERSVAAPPGAAHG